MKKKSQKRKVTARQVGKTQLVTSIHLNKVDPLTGLSVPTVGTIQTCNNTKAKATIFDPTVPLDDIPFFKTLALGTKLYKKGTPSTQVYQLRRSPQGRLFLYCKSTCEFVETTTVPVQFTPIG